MKGKVTIMNKKKIVLSNVEYAISEKKILNNINLCIEEGEKIAICGPNGAGKSTLINLMLNIPGMAFNSKTHKVLGSIENTLFDTKTYQDVKVHLQNSKISYNLYLRVGELLRLCFDDEVPMDLVEKFGLKDKLNNLVRTLSGGELQKLNIILVIGTNPKVIFLDEMTTGLDYEARKDILSYIREYTKEKSITLIFVTHYLEEVTALAEKICFIKQGKIVEEGKIAELFKQYNITNGDICKLYEEVIGNE